MRLGFIGLGVMGRPMALNLMRAGHDMAVFARRPESAQPLVAAGAIACASAADVARRTEVIFTMVTSSEDVAALALGRQGVVEGAAPGTVVVDMSTIAPSVARHIAAELAARGLHMLDAPVSGGEQGAINATLAIMVGGDSAVLARVRPLLEILGRTIVHIGLSGAGQVAKACNQLIMVTAIEAAAEALALAARSGVDPARVREALAGGSAGSRALDLFGAKMVTREFKTLVEARLHHKDFGLILGEAVQLGTPLPIAAQVWQQLNALMACGWDREDTSSLLRVLERESGASA